MFPHANAKKYKFYIVVDPANKFVVPMATNKTVDDLISTMQIRLRKKYLLLSNNNTNNQQQQPTSSASSIDIDSLSTMYWVDAQSYKPQHIYVLLRGTDSLQKILSAYKSMVVSPHSKLKEFYWFLTRSPSSVLNISNLRPNDIRMPPNEIRQKYHRCTPFLYPGFYFNFFIAKKYHGPNHQEKRKQIELYRQLRLQSKYHLNSPIPTHISNNNNKNDNNNSNSNSNQISNNRGRYVTANAMNEIRHHQKHQNPALPLQKPTEHSMNNETYQTQSHTLHWAPKQEPSKNNDSYREMMEEHRRTVKHCKIVTSSNTFDDIPSYLMDEMDDCWSYLFHSFDFKYILLLCFVCRCLNQGILTPAHAVKLGESAKLRQLTDEEFDICIEKSVNLNCDHVKEIIGILSKQNDQFYVNFPRMIVYDCLVHLGSDDFEKRRLDILRICSQFGVFNGLAPVEIACIIEMYQTEYQLLNVYRRLF